MTTLDDLVKLPGAMAAFEFRGGGEMLEHRIAHADRINESTLDLLAHMCAANLTSPPCRRAAGKVTGMVGFLSGPVIYSNRPRLVGGGERLASASSTSRPANSVCRRSWEWCWPMKRPITKPRLRSWKERSR
ncbi:MAG: DUF2173 family protein [Candidatus Competibacteraceae bacterium]|nr:DUF2173 family protein [Candidatus Competibacteraceae bacterium]